jgi:hypothetical protein
MALGAPRYNIDRRRSKKTTFTLRISGRPKTEYKMNAQLNCKTGTSNILKDSLSAWSEKQQRHEDDSRGQSKLNDG